MRLKCFDFNGLLWLHKPQLQYVWLSHESGHTVVHGTLKTQYEQPRMRGQNYDLLTNEIAKSSIVY